MGRAADLARAGKHRGFLARRRLQRTGQAVWESIRPRTRRKDALVRAGFEFDALPRAARVPGSVWGVAMVRNEADIIALTVEHLFSQGVEGIVVVDNGSTDDTLSILRELAGRFRVVVGTDHERAYYQAEKMTALARIAANCGADWIVPFDADEWWFGAEGEMLADTLRSAPTGVAVAGLHNCFPDPNSQQPKWRIDTAPARLEKVAFRWHRIARLQHGNHGVFHPDQPHRLLHIAHFPWRSLDQFRHKIRHGAAAIDANGTVMTDGGDHWRQLNQLDDAGLRQAWAKLLDGTAPEWFEWIPRGELVAADVASWSVWPSDPGVTTADTQAN